VNVALVAVLIPLVAVIGIVFLVALLIVVSRGGSGKQNTEQKMHEAELIQELHHGFVRMEQRIEALETIMLERKGAE
jgi:phage shock protein B